VIISIEMHCSHDFQKRMWEICRDILGDMLLILDPDVDKMGMEALPSPEKLKHKIIIKGKRGMQTKAGEDEEKESLSETSSNDGDSMFGALEKSRSGRKADDAVPATDPNWAMLPYLWAIKFTGFHNPGHAHQMSSFGESRVRKLVDAERTREHFVTYNKKQFSRIYPKGSRVDSSNLNPITSWAVGCQMVALNYQTGDAPMSLNFGKFLENNQFGYVLKSPYLRGTGHRMEPLILRVTVLSCQRLPNNNNSRDIIDPYVKLDLHGVGSDNKQGLYKTRTVLDNGFNPVFNNGRGETFAFEIYDPDSAILRIIAMDEDVGQDDFIGACSVPVSVLRAGYRHVPLLDEYNTAVRQAGILCRFWMDPIEKREEILELNSKKSQKRGSTDWTTPLPSVTSAASAAVGAANSHVSTSNVTPSNATSTASKEPTSKTSTDLTSFKSFFSSSRENTSPTAALNQAGVDSVSPSPRFI